MSRITLMSVSQPFVDLWHRIVTIGPRWLVALAIVVVAWLLAKIVGKLVQKAVGRTSTEGHVDILVARGASALIIFMGAVLALAEELGAAAVDLLLDSRLIVEQLNGRWKVKDSKLVPLHADARARLGNFARWSATHVPRAQNRQADALCNEAIDRAGAGGPRVVVVGPGRAQS